MKIGGKIGVNLNGGKIYDDSELDSAASKERIKNATVAELKENEVGQVYHHTLIN